jgi:vacuolar protein sorting-associated protein 13A/C
MLSMTVVQVGYVAWPDIEEPPLTLVACLRRDLVAPARLFDYPVWSGVSSDNQVGWWRSRRTA